MALVNRVNGDAGLLAREAWKLFRRLEAQGVFRRRVLLFTVNLAPAVRDLMTEIFGAEPLASPVGELWFPI